MTHLLGTLAVAILSISYAPYFVNTLRGTTKPHVLSWFIWSVLNAIGFAGQLSDGGGSGAWVTGFMSLLSFSIFLLSVRRGERHMAVMDWFSLGGATLALLLWAGTGTPLLSVILISAIDISGFLPSIRKAWRKPHEETAVTFALVALSFVLSLFALDRYTTTTCLYPVAVVLINSLFALMLVIRRWQLRPSASPASSR